MRTGEDTPADTDTEDAAPESGQEDNTAAVTIWTDRYL